MVKAASPLTTHHSLFAIRVLQIGSRTESTGMVAVPALAVSAGMSIPAMTGAAAISGETAAISCEAVSIRIDAVMKAPINVSASRLAAECGLRRVIMATSPVVSFCLMAQLLRECAAGRFTID